MPPGKAGPLLCPSAQPGMTECQVLGVASGNPGEPFLAYLDETLPATPEMLRMAEPALPTEVFRLAAHCEQERCTHFDGARCRLATRIVEMLPAVSTALPPCVIRAGCRWFRQEGRAACLRCPQIVTSNIEADERLRSVAGMPNAGEA